MFAFLKTVMANPFPRPGQVRGRSSAPHSAQCVARRCACAPPRPQCTARGGGAHAQAVVVRTLADGRGVPGAMGEVTLRRPASGAYLEHVDFRLLFQRLSLATLLQVAHAARSDRRGLAHGQRSSDAAPLSARPRARRSLRPFA